MQETTRKRLTITGLVLLALLVLARTIFTLDETQYAVVTQFGRPVRTLTTAGLKAKWPWQSLLTFEKRLLVYNPRPSEFLTRDKKNLVVDNYVCWRIAEPNRFLQTVNDVTGAEMRLHDTVWAAAAAALGNTDLAALVSTKPEEIKLAEVMQQVTEQCRAHALEQYGIEIVDVRIKRLNLPTQNRESVFARMRAERERIARQYRAEGEAEALKIRAEADKEKSRILSESYSEAERIRGDGDAESTKIYGEAYSRNPKFYKLVRTLEAYKKVIDPNTTAILSSDSELLKLLTQGRMQ
ncbi:MAG TPA: protease modulator HflC [Blastocatellia bacterium]|nr:protease modulator HflC [Blastocatellia bacterium]